MNDINQNKLFYIIGVGRSGTTLLQEIMNQFRGFCNLKESRIIENNKLISLWYYVRKSKDFLPLKKFIHENWTGDYFVEKTPDSILCLKDLIFEFPKSNYLFLERDPLKVILSQLNMFSKGTDVTERQYHVENLIMEQDDLSINPEQYFAKLTLKQVYHYLNYKNKFENGLIIKYESLVNDTIPIIRLIEQKFSIIADYQGVMRILKRPSSSSLHNKYEINEIKDKQALTMIKTARRLLNYN